MNKEIQVINQGEAIYPILLTNSFDGLNDLLADLNTNNKKICIVSDTNVSKHYMDEVLPIIKDNAKYVYTFAFQAGEKNKNLDTVYLLYEKLINWKFDRKDILIALGGGVVGDLTGYVAATYLRGISFIQIPTSLLAMVDSSIGGKTGVDFSGYKNMIGAFYQPSAVYINTKTLESLSKEHFYNGMAEIIKHGLILDLDYYKWLQINEDNIHSFDSSIISQMIYKSCIIKKDVVENDPKEQGNRALLNFGHTIGHAIEKAMNFEMLHGECVSIGLVAACYISMNQGYLSKDEFVYIVKILHDFNLPVDLSSDIHSLMVSKYGVTSNSLLEDMAHDKKQESGKLKFILLKEIGQAFIETNVPKDDIKAALKYILK